MEDLVISTEQAAQLVSGMGLAGISAENIANGPAVDSETGAPPAGAQDFGLRGYNLFWTDPGSTLAFVKESSGPLILSILPMVAFPELSNPSRIGMYVTTVPGI